MPVGKLENTPHSCNPLEFKNPVPEHKSSSSERKPGQGLVSGSLSEQDEATSPIDHSSDTNSKSGNTKPPTICTVKESTGSISNFVGLQKGIEGRNNSCYMDAVLVSILMTTKEFIKSFQSSNSDHPIKSIVLKHLRNVTIQLRNSPYFCSYKDIQPLKDSLAKVNPRFNGQMMDVDELINILFGSIFNLKPFMQYSVSTSNFLHQIILPTNNREREDNTVQSLLQESITNQGLEGFEEVPDPALLIAMPRSKGKLVGVDFVIPNLVLDVTDLCSKDKQTRKDAVFYLHAVICLKNLHYTAYIFDEKSESYLYYDSMSNSNGKSQIWSCPGFGSFLEKVSKKSKFGLAGIIAGEKDYQRVLTDCRLCIYLPTPSKNSRPSNPEPGRSSSPIVEPLQSNHKKNPSPESQAPSIQKRHSIQGSPNVHEKAIPSNTEAENKRKLYKDRNIAVSPDSMFAKESPPPTQFAKLNADVDNLTKPPLLEQLNCLEATMLAFFKVHDPFHKHVIEMKGGKDLVKSSIRRAIKVMSNDNSLKLDDKDAFNMILKNLEVTRVIFNHPQRLIETMWQAVSPDQKFIKYGQPKSNGIITTAYVHNLFWKDCEEGGPISIKDALIMSLKDQDLVLQGIQGPGLIISVDRSKIRRSVLPSDMLDVSELKPRKSNQTAAKPCKYRLYSVMCKMDDDKFVVFIRTGKHWTEYESFGSNPDKDNLTGPNKTSGPMGKTTKQYDTVTNPPQIMMTSGTIYIYVES